MIFRDANLAVWFCEAFFKFIDPGPQPEFPGLVVNAENDSLGRGGIRLPRDGNEFATGFDQPFNFAHVSTPIPIP